MPRPLKVLDPDRGPTAGARPAAVSSPEPTHRGEVLLEALDRAFTGFERWLGRVVPPHLDPITHSGAIATTTFLVASVTGIALLLWYVPSVHGAWQSVRAMGDSWVAGPIRSLHRYSSDACLAASLVHALRLLAARRVSGPRWLAWVTGVLLLSALWFVGWLGYWLVWDEGAHAVALATARMTDVVPVFADPLSRSFLTDDGVQSLLFFVVFFFHMLLPLAMGIPLWLHITRLSRPRYLTRGALAAWLGACLLFASLVQPAHTGPAARMLHLPTEVLVDGWYAFPLVFTDRWPAWVLWTVALVGGAVLYALPWWLARGRPTPAKVDPARCNGCRTCATDCPYGAIVIEPRAGDSPYQVVARVDPARCVGCGICAGSCDSAGIGLPQIPARDARRRVEDWLEEASGPARPAIAVLCATSAGARFAVDPFTGRCDSLPGYQVLAAPCAGWVHPTLIDRALKRGARGVLVVGCPPASCRYREGDSHTAERLAGTRGPGLRAPPGSEDRVRHVALARGQEAELVRLGQSFLAELAEGEDLRAAEGTSRPASLAGQGPRRSLAARATGVAVAVAATGLLVAGSRVSYHPPGAGETELVVSFKLPGQMAEQCRELSADEKAAQPAHMRRDRICERRRIPVRLRIRVDGEARVEKTLPPAGLWGDGNSQALERLPVSAGTHRVAVDVGDGPDPQSYTWSTDTDVEFPSDGRRVLLLHRDSGFRWY